MRSKNKSKKDMQNGYISFYHKGGKFKGYILECGVDIAKNTEQDFKLLLTPENDLTLLF